MYFQIAQLLRTADCRQGRAEGLRSEETDALRLRLLAGLLRARAPVAAHLRPVLLLGPQRQALLRRLRGLDGGLDGGLLGGGGL